MTERKQRSNIELGMSTDDMIEVKGPVVFPELRDRMNHLDLAGHRSRPENYEAELDAQAIGFIRAAMLKKHTQPDIHTPIIADGDLEALNKAETVDDFKSAIEQAYSNPEHMIKDAKRFFEEDFPGNGRNGEGLDVFFRPDESDGGEEIDGLIEANGIIGLELINIRTRARKILDRLASDFKQERDDELVSAVGS